MKDRLQSIELWLREEIKPLANEIDRHPEALKRALESMGDRSLLALKVPSVWGGSNLSELDYRLLQIKLARYSGALTFLQTQHQSAGAMLAKSDNQSLKEDFLPHMGRGKELVGVGFSHLRRKGSPMVSGKATATGYELWGEVPWITGYGFFDRFIVGATLEDGRELYGLLPLQNRVQDLGGSITLSQPMDLMAMNATNTVSAKINGWRFDSDRLVAIKSPGAIHHNSRRNILNHGWFALGCAYGGLDLLLAIANKKQLDFLRESWQALEEEVKQYETKAIALASEDGTSYQDKLHLRAQIINVAQRCSQAAAIASSGAANYLSSDAARIYREALLFSVSGQTLDVMSASMQQLLPQE